MALDDDIDTLGEAALFRLMDREARRLLAFAAERRTLREGEVLFRKGERSDGGYVVTRGTIALDTSEDGSGEAFIAGPATLIGQTTLFVRRPRAATATARERSSLLRISPSLMRRVLEEFPDAAALIHRALADDLATLTDSLEGVRRRFLSIDQEQGAGEE